MKFTQKFKYVYLICTLGDTMTTQRKDTIRVQVTFTKDQMELIRKSRGFFGSSDAEAVRNIVLAWLAEKSIVSTTMKERKESDK